MTTLDASSYSSSGQMAWHRLLQASRLVLSEIDARLDREHRISVNEFDVLITLAGAPDRRLRMSELADAVMFSSGGLTRLIGRLEERGLVERVPDEQDGRSFHATLTAAGMRLYAKARATHDAAIDDLVTAKLTEREVAALARGLARVVDAA